MTHPEPLSQSEADEVESYRRTLRRVVEINLARLELLAEEATVPSPPDRPALTPVQQAKRNLDHARAMAQISRAIRQSILMAQRLGRPPRAAPTPKFQAQASERAPTARTETGQVERLERLDVARDRRPTAVVIASLCATTGLPTPTPAGPPASSRPLSTTPKPTCMDKNAQARQARLHHHLKHRPPAPHWPKRRK